MSDTQRPETTLTAEEVQALVYPWRIEAESKVTRSLIRRGLLAKVCGDHFTTTAGHKALRPIDGETANVR